MHGVMEHYGKGLLELLAVSGTLAIVIACIGNDGVFQNMVINYLFSLCG